MLVDLMLMMNLAPTRYVAVPVEERVPRGAALLYPLDTMIVKSAVTYGT
jgi:hypothetical protein